MITGDVQIPKIRRREDLRRTPEFSMAKTRVSSVFKGVHQFSREILVSSVFKGKNQGLISFQWENQWCFISFHQFSMGKNQGFISFQGEKTMDSSVFNGKKLGFHQFSMGKDRVSSVFNGKIH